MSSGKKAKRQRQKKQQPQARQTAASNSRPAVSAIKQPGLPLPGTLPALALIVFIGLLIYANTLNAPFVLDDHHHIIENPFIRITRISLNDLRQVLSDRIGNRPLATLTFAANYYIHQYDVTGYHIVNMMIHIIAAFLLFLIIRQTMNLCRMENTWIALPAALLWLVNPVHTQSVTYIVQRMNSMAAMFYLLAVACYILGRLMQRRGGNTSKRPILLFITAAIAGLLGMASKQIAATLPIMIFLYEWYFFQDLNRDWFKKQVRWIFVMAILLIIVALAYLKGDPLAALASQYAWQKFSMVQRLLTEPGVVLYYLSLLLYPSPDRLRLLYQLSPATSLLSPATTLLSFISMAGLIATALLLRNKNRLFSFAIAWFLINLIIESSIIPLALVFEHRTYLPSAFIFVPPVVMLFQKTSIKKATAIISAAIILCGFWTWQRNTAWADQIVFWEDAAKKTPNDPRTHYILGVTHKENGNPETALIHLKAALGQDKTYEKAYNNIGMALLDLNRPKEAVAFLKKAIALNSDYKEAHYNLGQAFNRLGQKKKAESEYATVLKLNPLYEKAHNNIGLIKMDRGQTDEAMVHFKRALAIDPYYEKPYNNMGIASFKKGDAGQARTYLEKALALHPEYTEAAGNLDNINRMLEKHGQTITRLKQARRERPDDPEIALQLAAACWQAAMTDLAVDLYEQTLLKDPQCEKCLDALAEIYKTINRYDRAAQMLERLALLNPEKPDIFYGLARAYAQDNQKEQAVDNLRKAVSKGFDDINHIRSDNTLKAIRDTDYFRNLTAGYQ